MPFPTAVDDHQTANARFLADRGGAVLVPESSLTAESLATQLRSLAGPDRRRRDAMAEAARRAAMPGAAERLADLCLVAGAAS